jgi:hypothetical protein
MTWRWHRGAVFRVLSKFDPQRGKKPVNITQFGAERLKIFTKRNRKRRRLASGELSGDMQAYDLSSSSEIKWG